MTQLQKDILWYVSAVVMAFVIFIIAMMVGCAPVLQIKQDDKWQDIARVKGSGSFEIEYDEQGNIKELKADTKRPPLIDLREIEVNK